MSEQPSLTSPDRVPSSQEARVEEVVPIDQPPGDRAAEMSSPGLAAAIAAAQARGYEVEVLSGRALRVVGRFGEPTLGALELLIGAQAPVGVWAEGESGSRSALCLWTGTDFFAVTLGVGGRWEHFRAPQGLGMVRDSWRAGDRGRYRVPRGPLMQRMPEVFDMALEWGFPPPVTTNPQQARVTPEPKPSRGAGATRSRVGSSGPSKGRAASTSSVRRQTDSTSSRGEEEAPPKVCPSCFMVLPATGRCDYCA
ncbi:hypothetical protein KEM60_00415 [Austwickia sp. TVS 96-490-7B]|uniref:hypothetical protein n=1 Tax=Austwickia sp. TVS 96-490-7B TaxID=2830843 RepID=UPI001C579B82|nr:hypothetical protein [Austwickia sp. TVS 96-490-7B]MBW3084229.1 hypothetical protein [Austwickia sp. TVS 96-490-7B]